MKNKIIFAALALLACTHNALADTDASKENFYKQFADTGVSKEEFFMHVEQIEKSIKVVPYLVSKTKHLKHYYLEKTDKGWQITADTNLKPDNRERIFFDPSTSRVFLGATPPQVSKSEMERKRNTSDHSYECFRGVFGTSVRDENTINICASNLTKDATSVGTVVTGGLNLVFGTVRTRKKVDTQAIHEAITSSGLKVSMLWDKITYDAQKQKKEKADAQRMKQEQLARYRNDYKNISTVAQAKVWLKSYEKNDPDGLAPKVSQKLAKLDAAEKKSKIIEAKYAEKAAKLFATPADSPDKQALFKASYLVLMERRGWDGTITPERLNIFWQELQNNPSLLSEGYKKFLAEKRKIEP